MCMMKNSGEKEACEVATDDERAFWQSLLDIVPVPNEG